MPQISLAGNLEEITPETIEKYLELPGKVIEDLLWSLIDVFNSEWMIRESSGYSTAEERAVPVILRKAARIQALNYLLIDAPLETTGKIIKGAVEIARLWFADAAGIIKKFEEETVKRAVEYGMNYLLQKEIRVTPGAIEFEYTSIKGVKKQVIFQYIVIYKSIDSKRGNIEIRFYSPAPLEPPKNEMSYGGMWGIYTELTTDLPPFIVDIQGAVENFEWVGSPSVDPSFPDYVPDLGIKPLSRWERHVLKPLKEQIKKTRIVLEKILEKSGGIVENIKSFGGKVVEGAESLWGKMKDGVSWLGAQVGFLPESGKEETSAPEPLVEETESELEELQKIITSLEEKLKEEQGLRVGLEANYESEINEIVEKLDNLAEMIDLLSQEMTELTEAEAIALVEELAEAELLLEETEEEEIEEVEEGIEQEQIILCERDQASYPNRDKVIFNEIAWMGTKTSANDEWIELKNISGSEIDLSGWQILDKDEQIQIIFSEGDRVSAAGFFLLERTDDDSLPNILADKIYTGALNDTNEALYLFNENCELEDEVLANPSWPAGDKSSKRTMERKSNFGWQDSSNIGGTPKGENSGGYYYGGGGGGGDGGGTPPPEPTFCSQDNLSSPTHWPITINEIAWMGTLADYHNEWFELKNISEGNVSLKDWQILDKDEEIKILFNEGERVSPNSFYLLERTDDDSVPSILADKIYTGNLEDNDESLRLFDESCNLIDEVLANMGDNLDWPAGDKQERRSMERNQDLSWHTYSGEGENEIMGTPKAANSQPEDGPLATGILEVLPESLEFTALEFGSNPQSQTLTINNIGDGILEWTGIIDYTSPSVDGIAWLTLDPDSGTAPSQVSVSPNISGLGPGDHTATITIEAPDAQNSPQQVSVTLSLTPFLEIFSPATYVVISEVQVANDEFVELYNPTESDVNVNGWYFSYFSSERDWDEPYRNKKFPEGAVILAKSYYLIGLEGYPEGEGDQNSDWQVYDSPQLSGTAGAVAIFSCDPKNTEENPKTPEEAKSCKIDALGWGETLVKEGDSATAAPSGKSSARKLGVTEEGYLNYTDTDNNRSDFEIQKPSPKARNQHPYSDLDGDGLVDSYDPKTIVTDTISLEPGKYDFKDLVIENNAKLILNSDPSLKGFQGVKINVENLILEPDSSILADSKGYPAEQGPGSGQTVRTGGGSCSGYCGFWLGGGGGYGGIGGQGAYPACHTIVEAGLFYGSLEEPADLGSGGGSELGGAGGGAVRINVLNTLTLNGIISANGEDGDSRTYTYSGGGSGGSIYITTNILEGSGSITTNGGQGVSGPGVGGGGAGGRIAIYYQSSDFSGNIQAYGGDGYKAGGPGTIFMKSATQEQGDLIINNNNLEGSTQLTENWTFDNLKVLNSSHLYLPENLTVTNIEVKDNSVLESLTAATINTTQFDIAEESSLIGPNQVFLTIKANTFSIQSESKIVANVDIDTGDFFLDSNSFILADSKGYPAEQGPGSGQTVRTGGGSCSGYCGFWLGGGGGYGGIGGQGAYPACHTIVEGGLFYGSLEEPTDLGSGGGTELGGAGGGAIRIEVTNNLTLNGLISANGEDGDSRTYTYSGGGSGGSIYITTNILEGSGSITTNGGQGVSGPGVGGGGAGGRIAIYYQSNDFTGVIQAQGGTGYQNGGEGTIFLGD